MFQLLIILTLVATSIAQNFSFDCGNNTYEDCMVQHYHTLMDFLNDSGIVSLLSYGFSFAVNFIMIILKLPELYILIFFILFILIFKRVISCMIRRLFSSLLYPVRRCVPCVYREPNVGPYLSSTDRILLDKLLRAQSDTPAEEMSHVNEKKAPTIKLMDVPGPRTHPSESIAYLRGDTSSLTKEDSIEDKCGSIRYTSVSKLVCPLQRISEPLEMGDLIDDPSVTSSYRVTSFPWTTTSTQYATIFNSNIGVLAVNNLRVKQLAARFAFFRFDVKFVVFVTNNLQTLGTLYCCHTPSITPQNNSALPINFGIQQGDFLMSSEDAHICFEIPWGLTSNWATSTSDLVNWIGSLECYVFHQLVALSGAATSLNVEVHMQIVNARGMYPKAPLLTTQGLFDFSTTNITISDAHNSTLPINMSGDSLSATVPAFGMDYPSDTRQMANMRSVTFQKTLNCKGTLDIHRATFTACDYHTEKVQGVDTADISWIFSRPTVRSSGLNYSTTAGVGTRITALDVVPWPATFNNLGSWSEIKGALSVFAHLFRYKYLNVSVQMPKIPYLNGKLLATLSYGSTPQTTLSGTVDMSAVPARIIDLSSSTLNSVFRIPYMGPYDWMPTTADDRISAESTLNHYPRLQIYVLVPPSSNIGVPTSIPYTISYWYEGAVLNYGRPGGLIYNAVTTQAEGEEVADLVRYKHSEPKNWRSIDDLINLKQLWLIPHKHSCMTFPDQGNWSYDFKNILNIFPHMDLFNVFQGSLRFHLSVTNLAIGEECVVECGYWLEGGNSLANEAFVDVDFERTPGTTWPQRTSGTTATQNVAGRVFNANANPVPFPCETFRRVVLTTFCANCIVEVPINTARGPRTKVDQGYVQFRAINSNSSTPNSVFKILISVGDDFVATFMHGGLSGGSVPIVTGAGSTVFYNMETH